MVGRPRKYNVTDEQFVETWQKASSPKDVSAKTGIPLPLVYARKNALILAGVPLIKHGTGIKRNRDLAELAKKFLPEGAEVQQMAEMEMPDARRAEIIREVIAKLRETEK